MNSTNSHRYRYQRRQGMQNNKDLSWPALRYGSAEDLSPHQIQNAESKVTDTPSISMVHPEKEL